MDMETAKECLATSAMVFWQGSVDGHFNEPGVPVREVTE